MTDLLLTFGAGALGGAGITLVAVAGMGDNLQLRIRWHRVVQHTACRVLGHKWTEKLSGRLCRRCVTFFPR